MNRQNNIRETKQALRRFIREQKKKYDAAWREEVSDAILARLEQNPLFQEASCLLFYHSLPDEVQTAKFLQKWHPHKRFILPVVEGDHLLLREYDPANMQTESFGIAEPQGDLFENPEQIDLAIIPGMAFDRKGNRLGRGKGYYDRLLPSIKAPKIGIAFSWQLLEEIPIEPFDETIDAILTETEHILKT